MARPSLPPIDPELKRFIDAVIMPTLLERFLREQAAAGGPSLPAVASPPAPDLPQSGATV